MPEDRLPGSLMPAAGLVTGHVGCLPTAATTATSTAGFLGPEAGITPKIARKGTVHGSGLGRTRWVVERFAWLHHFKRLRVRYGIRAGLHLGLHQLACSIICLR